MRCQIGEEAPEILIVEDDSTFLSFWGRLLKDLGVRGFELVSTPKEAQDAILSHRYRLIVSDINMPGINGYELAKLACNINPDSRIILTTAYSTDLSRFDLENCQFHLLHKPYLNISDLKKFIQHMLDGDDSFDDLSEDSFSESNEDYPDVMEWKL